MLNSLILSEARKAHEQGIQNIDESDYHAALPYFTKAIELYPQNPVFVQSRSFCYSKLGKHFEALHDARTAIGLDDTFLEGHLTIAKSCLDLGDLTALKIAVARSQELDPPNTLAAKYERAWTSLQGYEDKYKEARRKEDYKEGLFYMDRALVYSPRCCRFKTNKAECLVYLGQLRESLHIVNEVLSKESTNVDAIYIKALCNYYEQRFTAVLDILKLLFKITNDEQRAKHLQNRTKKILKTKEDGRRAYHEKKYYHAIYLYEQALKIDPKYTAYNIKLHCNCAAVLMHLKKFKEAVEACTKALDLDQTYCKALIRRAKCQEAMKNWRKALDDYGLVLELEYSETVLNNIKAAKIAFRKTPYYYYKLLEVNRFASDVDIKCAFRKQSLLYHPDKHQEKSKQTIAEMEETVKDINAAYAVLSDRKKRMEYDIEQLRL